MLVRSDPCRLLKYLVTSSLGKLRHTKIRSVILRLLNEDESWSCTLTYQLPIQPHTHIAALSIKVVRSLT